MLDVIIGLLPAVIAAGYFFRSRALLVICVCVLACMTSEWLCTWIRKRPYSLSDLSAVVTGIILALSLPPAIPLWIAALGGVFAIVVAKMLFGGLGSNVFNPAMAARAFLTASFGVMMTTWTVPATMDNEMAEVTAANTQATSQATPLAWSKMTQKEKDAETQKEMIVETNWMAKPAFWGNVGGCLGETSTLALLLGGIYMLVRRTIPFHLPLAVLLSAAVFSGIFWLIDQQTYATPLLHLTGGGLMICAFFIATDPVTAPLSVKGMWIFGVGVGVLIMLIRIVGEYPEGVMYAVLIMNAFTPLIDRMCKGVPAGGKPNV